MAVPSQAVILEKNLYKCPLCGQPLPQPVPSKESRLYCAFCREEIGDYSKFKWEGNTAINEHGEKLILCQHLYHRGTINLYEGTTIKPNESNVIVHLEHCKKYCCKDPQNTCPHDLWHLK